MIQINGEAEKSYPNECCGFIFGSMNAEEKYAKQIVASQNSSNKSEQYHRFEINPEGMMKAERFARAEQSGYHRVLPFSPRLSAVPSEYDRAHALPIYSYIIVSVIQGKAEEALSWDLDKGTDYSQFQSEIIIFTKEKCI